MICGASAWILLVGCAFALHDTSNLADQMLEIAKPMIKANGEDSITIPGFTTNITDVYDYNMGTVVCENGTLTDLSSIVRAGPAVMTRIVIRDDTLLSFHMTAKLETMKVEFSSCDVTILDFPAKNVKPQLTIGINGLAIVMIISGKGSDCTSRLQKSIVNAFSDITVVTGGATVVDGFLSGLIQGNQADLIHSIQAAIFASLGKTLTDKKICDTLFSPYLR